MLLTCKHVYVYSGDRCRLNVRGISHQCQCFYSWIAFACLYQVLRSLNISGLLIMLSCGIALRQLHSSIFRVYSLSNSEIDMLVDVFTML
mgnify:CR=1 FL=1